MEYARSGKSASPEPFFPTFYVREERKHFDAAGIKPRPVARQATALSITLHGHELRDDVIGLPWIREALSHWMYHELGYRCRTSLAMEEVGKRSAAPTLTASEKAHMQKLI